MSTTDRIRYREVVCFNCSHRFMWRVFVEWGWDNRKDIETGEECLPTTCPLCGEKMWVSSKSLVGLKEDAVCSKWQ